MRQSWQTDLVREPSRAIQAARWTEFLRYAPELGALLKRSDEVARDWNTYLTGRGVITTADLPSLSERAERDAQTQANLGRAAHQVQVPDEALAFRSSVATAIATREVAASKMKAALDRRDRLAVETTVMQEAKRDLDRANDEIIASLDVLCTGMGVTRDECMAVAGYFTTE